MPDELLQGRLRVEGLDVSYGRGARRRQVLHGVDLSLDAGETLGVIGESGSGKTTLARTILGLVRPDRGTIRITGEDVTGHSSSQWQRFRLRGIIQYVFQDPLKSLDPERTLGESIAEPLQLQGRHTTEVRELVTSRLADVALEADIATRYPGEVSGGQRQRVAIARALITDPQVIVLDEPVSALDAANRSGILSILRGLARDGVSLIFISHDLGSVAGLTDRTLVLYHGRAVESGETSQIVRHPQHPYTQLLVGSAPTLTNAGIDREERRRLRSLFDSGLEAVERAR